MINKGDHDEPSDPGPDPRDTSMSGIGGLSMRKWDELRGVDTLATYGDREWSQRAILDLYLDP